MVVSLIQHPSGTSYDIPFNKPYLTGNESAYLAEAIARGQISADGLFTQQCQALLERELGARKALLTTSGTHALEMAALLLDIQPGDEVLVPSFTFVSTANAFALRGARPRFVDVRPDTLNLDVAQLADLITPRTRAIVPVHYAGVGCEMDAIMSLAAQRRLPVIEDAAHALFAGYRGQALGTFGELAILSFHETKNFSCGEGGALLINREEFLERAEILRQKGTDRARFDRGQVDKYTWVGLGSSYGLSDLLAAFLYAQLQSKAQILTKRRRIFERYADSLREWAGARGVRLPHVPKDCQPNYHMFYLLLPSPDARQQVIHHLRQRGILSVFHYVPLHLSPMAKTWGYRPGDCPVAEEVSERLVRLPFYTALTEAEQARVLDAVREALRLL